MVKLNVNFRCWRMRRGVMAKIQRPRPQAFNPVAVHDFTRLAVLACSNMRTKLALHPTGKTGESQPNGLAFPAALQLRSRKIFDLC